MFTRGAFNEISQQMILSFEVCQTLTLISALKFICGIAACMREFVSARLSLQN